MLIERIKELKMLKIVITMTLNINLIIIQINRRSTFSLEDVLNIMEYQQVQGTHKFDDVLEIKKY